MLNLSKLFYSSGDSSSLSNNIKINDDKRKYLIMCKNELQSYLKEKITEVATNKLGMVKPIVPKFRTQGSWSYKTCINPAHETSQEIDWDLGIYLPIEVWEDNGPPREMAKQYFDLVESLLTDYCNQKHWKVITNKSTCTRVKVSNCAHIDIPLYAAPEHKFNQIKEKVESSLSTKTVVYDSLSLESIEFGEMGQEWAELDDIVLAMRDGKWLFSDPKHISDWFTSKVDIHGEQLRRVCRYLKAWRDFHWVSDGPSSVSIMIAVAQKFTPYKGRDDLALEESTKNLSIALTGELREYEIDDENEDFNKRLTQSQKNEASEKAMTLYRAINNIRELETLPDNHQLEIQLHEVLGERIPAQVGLISVVTNSLDNILSNNDDPEAVKKMGGMGYA